MVALNEQLQHCGVPISDGHMSLDVIGGCDFTKRSEEVHGGFVVICGVAGFCGLSDASPLRPRSAAPLNQNDPETQLYYVRNRTNSPALGRWIQRDPIGYQGGVNLYEYLNGRVLLVTDPMGEYAFPNNFVPGMGTFDVTITSEPAAANMPFRSHVQVEFHPSQAIIKQNKNCPVCTEIQAIQFADTRGYHGWGSSDFLGWHPDKDDPFFPGATPWRFGRPWPLVSSDDPGATWAVRFTSTGIRQAFKLYAVCTAGGDKGKSFGFAFWGHEFNWGF